MRFAKTNQSLAIGTKAVVLIGLMSVGLQMNDGKAALGRQASHDDSAADQVSASEASSVAKGVLRPMSVPSGNSDRLVGTIIYPDGDNMTIRWRSSRLPNYERHPVDEKVPELTDLARAGDAYAAFEAFRLLDGCVSVLDARLSTEDKIASLRKMHKDQQGSQDVGVMMSPQELERRIEYMRSHDAACRRLDPGAIETREDLLRQAAVGGVITAMNWLGSSTADLEEAIGVLEESWQAGSFSALRYLAQRYQQRYVTYHAYRDKVRAFAALYTYAALLENGQTLRGREANILTPRAWKSVEDYARQLDEEQIQEGIAISKSMIDSNANCCNTL